MAQSTATARRRGRASTSSSGSPEHRPPICAPPILLAACAAWVGGAAAIADVGLAVAWPQRPAVGLTLGPRGDERGDPRRARRGAAAAAGAAPGGLARIALFRGADAGLATPRSPVATGGPGTGGVGPDRRSPGLAAAARTYIAAPRARVAPARRRRRLVTCPGRVPSPGAVGRPAVGHDGGAAVRLRVC